MDIVVAAPNRPSPLVQEAKLGLERGVVGQDVPAIPMVPEQGLVRDDEVCPQLPGAPYDVDRWPDTGHDARAFHAEAVFSVRDAVSRGGGIYRQASVKRQVATIRNDSLNDLSYQHLSSYSRKPPV